MRVSTITAQTSQIYKHLHRGTIDAALTITSEDYDSDLMRTTIDVALVYPKDNPNPNIARLAACIPDIRKPAM